MFDPHPNSNRQNSEERPATIEQAKHHPTGSTGQYGLVFLLKSDPKKGTLQNKLTNMLAPPEPQGSGLHACPRRANLHRSLQALGRRCRRGPRARHLLGLARPVSAVRGLQPEAKRLWLNKAVPPGESCLPPLNITPSMCNRIVHVVPKWVALVSGNTDQHPRFAPV